MKGAESTAAPLSQAGRNYLNLVVVVGAAVVVDSVYDVQSQPLGYQWYILAALALLSGSATVQLASVPASISVSETFVFAAVLLFGGSAGTVTVALEALVISFWMARRKPEWYRALFNISAPSVSVWCASQTLPMMGVHPLIREASSIGVADLFAPVAVFAIVYFALNSCLIALAVGFETGQPAFDIWRKNLLWLALNYLSAASVGLLLVVYSRDLDLRFIAAVVPLILGFYFMYRTSWARVQDANQHLSQVNRLYLSTIETLAMAIDAKDQITHGHIRRVQTYAVGLARHIGITDENLIKAIEAAALLHDMGKLAVPEYILNKPGKLTPAEYEKMKLHASVGADILSSIDFPYPVVPIVRHHHESWNGTGYPAGLKGTDIPIGARILGVVDCFDALTSDRPYRPRLPDEEALKILRERRGSMYDPLVVDTFERVHLQIAPAMTSSGLSSDVLNEITSATQSTGAAPGSARLDEIAASADEMLTLYELAGALAGQTSISDTGDIIAKHLRRLIPFSLCVVYIYDAERDELEAKHAIGEATAVVKGVRVPLGKRLSGWVAANRQTITNSDPTLDLGEVARCSSPRLRSCLSTPLLSDDTLVGVLSLYSGTADSFTEDHRRILEAIARQIAHTFKSAPDFEKSGKRDFLTGLPNLKHLELLLSSGSPASLSGTSLLVIDIVGLKGINALHGRAAGDEVLRHVVKHTRAALRVADILFRSPSDELIALLNDTNPSTATVIADRILRNIKDQPVSLASATIKVDATVTWVKPPVDGRSLDELLAGGGDRTYSSKPAAGPIVH